MPDQLDHVVADVGQHQHPGPDPVGDLRLLILSPLGRGAVIVHRVLAVTSGLKMRFVVQWADDSDKALSNASNVTKEKVDGDSADQVKADASKT